jgi:hypothetical protein
MILIDDTFELGIPTHISFTLYKFDYIDGIIISRVLRDCKNWSLNNEEIYTVDVDSFKAAIIGNKRLKSELLKSKSHGMKPPPNVKPNSISFLWSIINKLHNLKWLSFNISYDKIFTRLVKFDNKKMLNFYFKIDEGVFDLTKIFKSKDLDIINKKMIEFGVIPNKYLDRRHYFYIKTTLFFDILGQLEIDEVLNTFDLLDIINPKLEDDDPLLLVITDYTPY